MGLEKKDVGRRRSRLDELGVVVVGSSFESCRRDISKIPRR
jgi:hypothetical protein